MAIRYTPGQFRTALGLTKETFRYWKRDMPALAAVAGRSPCFGPGDLVATAVAKRVTDIGGVPVSRLSKLAPNLFSLCRDTPWPQLERLSAHLFLHSGRVLLVEPGTPPTSDEPVFIVPLRPVIRRLRERLLAVDSAEQPSLALPPVAVSSGRRK